MLFQLKEREKGKKRSVFLETGFIRPNYRSDRLIGSCQLSRALFGLCRRRRSAAYFFVNFFFLLLRLPLLRFLAGKFGTRCGMRRLSERSSGLALLLVRD